MFKEPKQPTPEEYKRVIVRFDSLEEVIAFVKSFWMAVDPENAGRRVARKQPEDMKELTYGTDRTTFDLYPSAVYGDKYGVTIYVNSDSTPLSPSAIQFLKQKGCITE